MKIGIFGGSFDPVHNDHIKILQLFIKKANLDKVIVVPTFISPFKNGANVNGEHRIAMLNLAFKNIENVVVCNLEIKKQGKSYTFETVEEIRKQYKDDELFLLMGADNLSTFHKWKNPKKILENCVVTGAGRGGYNFEKAICDYEKFNNNVPLTFNFDGNISSSLVRELLLLGIYDEQFVPLNVLDYIRANNLYKMPQNNSYIKEEHLDYLKKVMKLKRLYHTAGVAITAKKLACQIGENQEKAECAGLLHDVAKYLSLSDFPLCKIPENCPQSIIHQYLGAYVAENVLKVQDKEILGAINYHTTGRPEMTNLEKIVFVADLIEPFRDYGEVETLRSVVFSDFEKGFKLCVERLLAHLEKDGQPVFPLTYDTAKYYGIIK